MKVGRVSTFKPELTYRLQLIYNDLGKKALHYMLLKEYCKILNILNVSWDC